MSEREVIRCKALSLDDKRCKRRVAKGYYCWQHAENQLHLRIKPSKIPHSGFGLFDAKSPFRINQHIAEYTGEKQTPDEYENEHNHRYGLQYSQNLIINPKKTSTSFAQYANTLKRNNVISGQPHANNAKFTRDTRNRKIWLTAKTNIQPGQEIFVNYGRSYRI
jgi:SET domain-containing protein